MNKQIGVYAYSGIFLAIRRNEVLIPATTWMNLGNIMLSERSQTQKGHILHDSIYAKHPE